MICWDSFNIVFCATTTGFCFVELNAHIKYHVYHIYIIAYVYMLLHVSLMFHRYTHTHTHTYTHIHVCISQVDSKLNFENILKILLQFWKFLLPPTLYIFVTFHIFKFLYHCRFTVSPTYEPPSYKDMNVCFIDIMFEWAYHLSHTANNSSVLSSPTSTPFSTQ